MGRIQSVSVGTSDSVPLDMGGGGKVIMHTDQDVRIAYDPTNLGVTEMYFILKANTTLVLDEPNNFDSLIYLRADSSAARVRTWVLRGGY